MREVTNGNATVVARAANAGNDYIIGGNYLAATRYREYDNNVEVSGSYDSKNNGGAWQWVLLRINATDVKLKTWLYGGSASAWTTESTLVSVFAAGKTGIYANTNGDIIEVAQFGVGTDGDPAPSIGGPVAVILDNSPLVPGKAMTGTYSNYSAAPTTATLTDSGGNILTPAVTIDDIAKTFGFTFPPRTTTGTGTTLLRGPVTLELT
jgi:hypothetical protein